MNRNRTNYSPKSMFAANPFWGDLIVRWRPGEHKNDIITLCCMERRKRPMKQDWFGWIGNMEQVSCVRPWWRQVNPTRKVNPKFRYSVQSSISKKRKHRKRPRRCPFNLAGNIHTKNFTWCKMLWTTSWIVSPSTAKWGQLWAKWITHKTNERAFTKSDFSKILGRVLTFNNNITLFHVSISRWGHITGRRNARSGKFTSETQIH